MVDRGGLNAVLLGGFPTIPHCTFRYRILDHEALTDPDICRVYPSRLYPKDAVIPAADVAPILETMRGLRLADPTFYLCAGSINLFNGTVSLTFSCDGSHYMP
jgi:hypothetical protein